LNWNSKVAISIETVFRHVYEGQCIIYVLSIGRCIGSGFALGSKVQSNIHRNGFLRLKLQVPVDAKQHMHGQFEFVDSGPSSAIRILTLS